METLYIDWDWSIEPSKAREIILERFTACSSTFEILERAPICGEWLYLAAKYDVKQKTALPLYNAVYLAACNIRDSGNARSIMRALNANALLFSKFPEHPITTMIVGCLLENGDDALPPISAHFTLTGLMNDAMKFAICYRPQNITEVGRFIDAAVTWKNGAVVVAIALRESCVAILEYAATRLLELHVNSTPLGKYWSSVYLFQSFNVQNASKTIINVAETIIARKQPFSLESRLQEHLQSLVGSSSGQQSLPTEIITRL